jgi:psiF repeat
MGWNSVIYDPLEGKMRGLMSLVVAFSIAGSACVGPAFGAEGKKERTPQQQRMSDCNKTAAQKELKGDDRKQFMKSCLSN